MSVIAEPEIRKFRLGDLNPATYNPRTISDNALEGLMDLLIAQKNE